MAKIKVTLTKSPIGAIPAHRKVIKALGLNKMHKTVEFEDCPAVRGAIQKVIHLVTVTE